MKHPATYIAFNFSGNGSSKEKKREKSKERHQREKTKDHQSNQRDHPTKDKDIIEIKDEPTFDAATFDKEEEQRRLELEMIKRKERIERWRAERKKKEIELQKKPTNSTDTPAVKKWSLEDEESDEDDSKVIEIEDSPTLVRQENVGEDDDEPIILPMKEPKEPSPSKFDEPLKKLVPIKEPEPELPVAEEVDDDVDPLDAYMKQVDSEVRKINRMSKPMSGSKTSGIVIVTGNAKKQQTETKKGELIEQNQDGLEYSSEEELEDIKDTAANLANKQKKELAKVDHTTMNYGTFKKNFYVEVPEITKMSSENVDAYRNELEEIHVKGKGCPRPIRTWAQCGISKKEMDTLKKLCFDKPTPIQCQAIPAIMSGRDLIGIAKTGSGKTIAFILPMFRHILDQPPLEEGDGPVAIIMSPTRELCMQIGKDIRKFSKSLNLRAVCVYGGTGISEQIAELKRGAEIIICTPGRMIDMLAANSGRVTNLRRVTYVVLDEADR